MLRVFGWLEDAFSFAFNRNLAATLSAIILVLIYYSARNVGEILVYSTQRSQNNEVAIGKIEGRLDGESKALLVEADARYNSHVEEVANLSMAVNENSEIIDTFSDQYQGIKTSYEGFVEASKMWQSDMMSTVTTLEAAVTRNSSQQIDLWNLNCLEIAHAARQSIDIFSSQFSPDVAANIEAMKLGDKEDSTIYQLIQYSEACDTKYVFVRNSSGMDESYRDLILNIVVAIDSYVYDEISKSRIWVSYLPEE